MKSVTTAPRKNLDPKVRDSEQKMNLNVTWSRRWRRRDATPPRRRRRGRQRVYASRGGVRDSVVPTQEDFDIRIRGGKAPPPLRFWNEMAVPTGPPIACMGTTLSRHDRDSLTRRANSLTATSTASRRRCLVKTPSTRPRHVQGHFLLRATDRVEQDRSNRPM